MRALHRPARSDRPRPPRPGSPAGPKPDKAPLGVCLKQIEIVRRQGVHVPSAYCRIIGGVDPCHHATQRSGSHHAPVRLVAAATSACRDPGDALLHRLPRSIRRDRQGAHLLPPVRRGRSPASCRSAIERRPRPSGILRLVDQIGGIGVTMPWRTLKAMISSTTTVGAAGESAPANGRSCAWPTGVEPASPPSSWKFIAGNRCSRVRRSPSPG